MYKPPPYRDPLLERLEGQWTQQEQTIHKKYEHLRDLELQQFNAIVDKYRATHNANMARINEQLEKELNDLKAKHETLINSWCRDNGLGVVSIYKLWEWFTG